MRHCARTFFAPLATLLILATATIPLQAQGVQWKRDAELNGSVFFGNTSQRLAAARGGISRADSTIELSLGARFTYADVESEEGVRAVNRRSWDIGAALDYCPFHTWSPFVFGTVESSLEKQIEMRYGAGAGVKYTFTRTENSEHSFSLAALAEQTTPRVANPDFNDELLARWSARHRVRVQLSEGVNFSSTTFYKPLFSDFTDYTIASVNSLGVALNSNLALTVTFVDTYDSESRLRGAESNNDGQLLFGLKASW